VTTPPRQRGSTPRLILGGTLFVGAIAVGVFGFLNLANVLNSGGYGTPAQRNALVILGAAGAALAAGIALVIWEVSERNRD
jgi:hypothetical protein